MRKPGRFSNRLPGSRLWNRDIFSMWRTWMEWEQRTTRQEDKSTVQYEIFSVFPSFVIRIGKGQAFPSGSRRMTLVSLV